MHEPKKCHSQAVQRILQYLKGSLGRGILYRTGEGLEIEAYTNANYAGSLIARWSTSGY